MKRLLFILPAGLILFTTACTAALVAPAAMMFEENLHKHYATATNNTSDSEGQMASVPTHVSGSKNKGQGISGQHVSGKTSRGHISGGSYSHVSGGGYY